jgi:predicted alpha-1,2-mannosidase
MLILPGSVLCAALVFGQVPNSNSAPAREVKSSLKVPVDYVDPNIGGIGHLLTSVSPEVQVPHGVVQVTPIGGPGVTDIYVAGKIYGFSVAPLVLMPAIGQRPLTPAEFASEIDHDKEIVTPYYSFYVLDRTAIRVEYTASSHSAYFRIQYPDSVPADLLFFSFSPAQFDSQEGTVRATFDVQGVRSYVYAEFSKPLQGPTSLNFPSSAIDLSAPANEVSGVGFHSANLQVLEVRVGFSYVSVSQAKQNLTREIAGWDFAAAKNDARAAWNSALSRVLVTGGSEEQKTIFYTSLYRAMQYMKDITEDDQYFGPYDHVVHPANGHHFYIEDNLWDTYRTRHPLQIILEPERQNDILRSYVLMYEQSGWMPHFPFMQGDLPFMIGNHAASMFADSYFKGFRDFDVEKAYEGVRKNSMQATMLPDRRGGLTELEHFYFEHGYFPALAKGAKEIVPQVNPEMRRQAVSVTLENSYDDWAISMLAQALEKNEDANYFGKRALNYRNVFDARIGFMAPRAADGQFIQDFNPKWSGGQAGRDYFTECNGLVYTFHVQHDVAGLIALIGGRQKFVDRLDDLFSDGYDGQLKFVFLAQFPDSTALLGQYPQGNEPAFHIPYLYNYAGAPWKTQKRVRDIMRIWYSAQPLGLPGDDDNGATSAWFTFSAMGFYPVSPGRPVYDIGSPLFERTQIDVGNGKHFTIVARNVSARNKYIQSARLNGAPLNRPWFLHEDLVRGGTLVLQMGPDPNPKWGSDPDAAPPSLSDTNPKNVRFQP